MNFFEQQEQARRRTRRLVVLFVLAVLGVVLAVDAGVFLLLAGGNRLQHAAGLLTATTLVTLIAIAGGSLYRMASLRGGGDSVAAALGGQWVAEDTRDPRLRRLRNVVEEVAIASGVPVPRLYVLEHEPRINAFAAGYSPSDAVIGVTRGALDALSRDELQGVVAHEFSHILNGDMRLNIRLMGWLYGILMIGLAGRKILELALRTGTADRRGDNREGRGGGLAVLYVLAVIAMVAGYLGVFFGRLIKAGVSRSRETLADASALQFTRQSHGLAGALKKIAAYPGGARLLVDRADAEEVSHLLFGDGVGLSGWFATHPPLEERIRRLEPDFDMREIALLREQRLRGGTVDPSKLRLHDAPSLPDVEQTMAISPERVVEQVAAPGADDYLLSGAITLSMPEALRALATQRATVMPTLLALLIDHDDAVADRQCVRIADVFGGDTAEQARRTHEQLTADLHPMHRLPLAAMAFPVLRQFPRPQLDAFIDLTRRLAQENAEPSLFEYCLAKLLRVQVREALDPGARVLHGRRKLIEVRIEATRLLAFMARAGADGESAARTSFLAGMRRLYPDVQMAASPEVATLAQLDAVWRPLDALDPLLKRDLVEALVIAVGTDGRMNVAEAELLRTVCGVLHCPLPSLLAV